jgi:hypothetical protein
MMLLFLTALSMGLDARKQTATLDPFCDKVNFVLRDGRTSAELFTSVDLSYFLSSPPLLKIKLMAHYNTEEDEEAAAD